MSIFVIHSTHELHQLKKALPLLRGDMTTYRHYQVIIPKESYPTTTLSPDDTLEILTFMGGGQ